MNRKRLFALAAILLMIGIAVPFAIGWALAAPVQISLGKAPSDLSAETVEFKSDSGAIVKGWWCPTVKQPRRCSSFARNPREPIEHGGSHAIFAARGLFSLAN
jgi:hypothetical protein